MLLITKHENTLFLTRIESPFCIVGSLSHELIIIAFYDEAGLVAVIYNLYLRAILCKYGASYIGTISRSHSDFDETY